jgi:hypothetical protein
MGSLAFKKTIKKRTIAKSRQVSRLVQSKRADHKISEAEKAVISMLENKGIKAKEKTLAVSGLLLNNKISIDDLVQLAGRQSDSDKGTLLAVMEFVSKGHPEIINGKAFKFAISCLKENAPRIKWEAAKVISNTAQLFPTLLKTAVPVLLGTSSHKGNVVRWSAATALAQIIALKKSLNSELIPKVEAILEWEKDNAIRKIYQKALAENMQIDSRSLKND